MANLLLATVNFEPWNNFQIFRKRLEKLILSIDTIFRIFIFMSLSPVFTEAGSYIYIFFEVSYTDFVISRHHDYLVILQF